MNEAFTIYKLIILYTLNEIESPLTFGLISVSYTHLTLPTTSRV